MSHPAPIGITGGIGSGKSVVTKIFQILGVPCYDADSRAKAVVNEDLQLREKIIQLLGPEAYGPSGYDRRYVAGKVFGNEGLLNELNSIIHPAVADDFSKWIKDHEDANYILKEAALLFESGSYSSLDSVILVTAPLELRIQRVLSRDPERSREEVLSIIERQWDEDRKQTLADYTISNGSQDLLIPQVLHLHRQFQQNRTPA